MAVFVVAGYSPVQHLDQWEEMFWLNKYYAGEARIADLFRLHNRHPIFVPRMMYLIDIFVFHATNIFLIPMSFLIQVSTCMLLVREVWIVPNMSRPLARFLAGVYLVFLFSARQYGNFTWGFQLQFVLVFAAAVAAAVFFSLFCAICWFPFRRIVRRFGKSEVVGSLPDLLAYLDLFHGQRHAHMASADNGGGSFQAAFQRYDCHICRISCGSPALDYAWF
jgi:hypothetical protein